MSCQSLITHEIVMSRKLNFKSYNNDMRLESIGLGVRDYNDHIKFKLRCGIW